MNIHMKKVSIIASTLGISLLAAPQAFADSACPQGSFTGLCFTSANLGSVIGGFITLGFVIVGLIALAFLVWGGLKWLLSQGEKQAVEEARNHIVAAIIGLIIIFLSYLIVNLVLGFITAGHVSLNNFTLPSLTQQ